MYHGTDWNRAPWNQESEKPNHNIKEQTALSRHFPLLGVVFLTAALAGFAGYEFGKDEKKPVNNTIPEQEIQAHPMHGIFWQACNKAIQPRFKESPVLSGMDLGAYLGDVQDCSDDATKAYITIEKQNPSQHKYY
jgi:hypothetical protein